MAQINQTICDNCGKIKGENNHWFGAEIVTGSEWDNMIRFALAYECKDFPHLDYCGQSCCIAALQQWLSSIQERANISETSHE